MNDRIPITFLARFRQAAVAFGLLLLCAGRVSAATLVTILSSDAQPYVDAQSEIHRIAAAHGDKATSVHLAEVSRNNTLKTTDVVVAIGSDAAAWAREHAPGQGPLYYCMVPNAADLGLNNAGRPCRGVVTDVPFSVQLDLISQTLPSARTVGMLYRSDLEQGRKAKADFEAALPRGWKLEAVAVNEFKSKSEAIDVLLSRSIDIVWTSPDPNVYDISVLKAVLLTALRKSVPVYGFSQAIVKSGGLVGTNISPSTQGSAVAEMIVADLNAPSAPSASEARDPPHEVIVNAIVAKKLNIALSRPLLVAASHVYEND